MDNNFGAFREVDVKGLIGQIWIYRYILQRSFE